MLPFREAAAGKSARVLILGGSQGAHAINEAVTQMATTGSSRWSKIGFVHQTGVQDEEWVKNEYTKGGIDAEVSAFIRDMAAVYRQADIVISRAGATTLAELAVMGKLQS